MTFGAPCTRRRGWLLFFLCRAFSAYTRAIYPVVSSNLARLSASTLRAGPPRDLTHDYCGPHDVLRARLLRGVAHVEVTRQAPSGEWGPKYVARGAPLLVFSFKWQYL
jgi:hypothetical protein